MCFRVSAITTTPFRSGCAVAGMPARLQLVQTIFPHVAVAREANAEGLLRGVVLQGLLPSFACTCLCQRPAPCPQPGAMKHAAGCPAMLASRPSAELAAASAARRLPAANQNAKLEAVAYSAFAGQDNTYSSMLDLQQIEGGMTSRAGCRRPQDKGNNCCFKNIMMASHCSSPHLPVPVLEPLGDLHDGLRVPFSAIWLRASTAALLPFADQRVSAMMLAGKPDTSSKRQASDSLHLLVEVHTLSRTSRAGCGDWRTRRALSSQA